MIGLSLLIAAICSLGDHLLVRGGRNWIPGPWLVLSQLPVLRYAIAVRLCRLHHPSRGADRRDLAQPSPWSRRLARVVLVAAAIAAIFPNVGSSAWNTHIADPAFFTSGTYRAYLKPNDRVLTIPPWGPNERWQADTGFRFLLADGYAGNPFPASYSRFRRGTCC